MHSKPTRRPSLMQLFRLHLGDRTNVTQAATSPHAAPALPVPAAGESKQKQKKQKKAKKKAEEDVDEAELVRLYGRAFLAEVALLQFMDGGSTAHNVQRALKKRAKLAAEGGQPADETRWYTEPEKV